MKLIPDKTELIASVILRTLDEILIKVENQCIKSGNIVKYLGFHFDTEHKCPKIK